MNTKTLRRPYAAPTAELISLVPSAPIASNGNWTWSDDDNNGKWDKNHMGLNIFDLGGSAIGFGKWVEENDELDGQ